MNMISTGAFQTEMDASNKQMTLAEKFVAAWEKKNAKAARAGGVSLMALSLAACGSSDDTTDTTADTTTDTTTTTPVAPTAQSLSFTANLDDLKVVLETIASMGYTMLTVEQAQQLSLAILRPVGQVLTP